MSTKLEFDTKPIFDDARGLDANTLPIGVYLGDVLVFRRYYTSEIDFDPNDGRAYRALEAKTAREFAYALEEVLTAHEGRD